MDPPAPVEDTAQPIVNGIVDPYDHGVVALTSGGFAFCSGTLVSPRVVLTAAHCIDENDVEGIRVQSGVRLGLGTSVPVLEAKVHEEYNGGSNDIAIVLLEAPSPARYWPLNTTAFDDTFLDSDVRLAGYGTTDADGGGDGQKREGIARIFSYDALDFVYTSNPAQTCFGDSGGPGFVTIDGVEYLAGITSRGDAECAQFGIDTRVDAYADWVSFFIEVFDPTVTDCGDDGTCALDCDAPDPDCPCEYDGYCSTECATLNVDRDCPPNCDHDGTCEENEDGCPVQDEDCHPTAGVGEVCEFGTDCVEGECIAATEDERVHYCSVACSSESDCPGDMVCEGSMCRHLPPSPGAQVWPCTADDDCFEGNCVPSGDDSICADRCVSDADCAGGNVCNASPLDGSTKLCLPESGGCGCTTASATPTQLAPFVLLLALALLRRRR
jgi:MYXO-CTERM domain-containing protein